MELTDGLEITLHWQGPYSFLARQTIPCVFDCEHAGEPGIYLWTVRVADGFLVNYVGETKTAFANRLAQNLRYYLGGQDNMVDAAAFAQGVRRVLASNLPIEDFLADYPRWSESINQVLRAYQVFLAPLRTETAIRQTVEAALATAIRDTSDRSREFLANQRFLPRGSHRLKIKSEAAVTIIGLPDTIDW